MITIIFCALLAGCFAGRHWTNLLVGGIFGFIIASIIGMYLPVKIAAEIKVVPIKISTCLPFFSDEKDIKFLFIKDNKIGHEEEGNANVLITDYNLLTYKKYEFSDAHSWCWGINYPFWYANMEITVDIAEKIGIL